MKLTVQQSHLLTVKVGKNLFLHFRSISSNQFSVECQSLKMLKAFFKKTKTVDESHEAKEFDPFYNFMKVFEKTGLWRSDNSSVRSITYGTFMYTLVIISPGRKHNETKII